MKPAMKVYLPSYIKFFDERENYKLELKKAIKKYGMHNLPKSVLRTVPIDANVLHEKHWRFNIVIWLKIIAASIVQQRNMLIKEFAK